MKYSKIKKFTSFVPKNTLTNNDLSKFIETSDEWIVKRTGIKNRHIASASQTTVDMAVNAMQEVPKDIDMLIVATYSGEQRMPSLACQICAALELENVIAFDVNAACSGFLFGLDIANLYIQSGRIKKAYVLGVDKNSNHVDWTDRQTAILFGDAAAGVLIEANDKQGIIDTVIGSDATHADLLKTVYDNGNEYIEMSGKSVFKIAVNKGVKLVQNCMAHYDIDWIVMHQANKRIIEHICKEVKFPIEQCFLNIDQMANTSAASIPLALHDMENQKLLKDGQNILLLGFGAGFTWSSVLFKFGDK